MGVADGNQRKPSDAGQGVPAAEPQAGQARVEPDAPGGEVDLGALVQGKGYGGDGLFVTRLSNRIVYAELFFDSEHLSYDDEKLWYMGTAMVYMFYFDRYNTIQKVSKWTSAYN
jgi:hypothetical protein